MDDKETRKHAVRVRSQIMQHNGNVAWRMFTGSKNPLMLRVLSISFPFGSKPTCVEVIDPYLEKKEVSNDPINPDGGTKVTFSNYFKPAVKPEPPKPAKKNHLKLQK